MVRATGEIDEYMRMDLVRRAMGENRREITYEGEKEIRAREEKWFADVQKYMIDWSYAHKDGAEDTWTKSQLFKDAMSQRADYVVAGEDLVARTRPFGNGWQSVSIPQPYHRLRCHSVARRLQRLRAVHGNDSGGAALAGQGTLSKTTITPILPR
jgi:hypothetical protein